MNPFLFPVMMVLKNGGIFYEQMSKLCCDFQLLSVVGAVDVKYLCTHNHTEFSSVTHDFGKKQIFGKIIKFILQIFFPYSDRLP